MQVSKEDRNIHTITRSQISIHLEWEASWYSGLRKSRDLIVDFHHHYNPSMAKSHEKVGTIYYRGVPQNTQNSAHLELNVHIDFMDRVGIDVAVISFPGAISLKEMREANRVNFGLQKACTRFPDRFVFLAHSVPLGGKSSLNELAQWLDSECPGAVIPTSYEKVQLDDPRMEDFYSLMEDKRKYIFIHPSRGPDLSEAANYNSFDLYRTIGREFALTRSLAHIILGGVLDRHPKLVFLVSHFGGGISGYVPRIMKYQDKKVWGVENDPIHGKTSAKPFKYYLNRIYFDTAGYFGDPKALASAMLQIPKSRILFGSDYPSNIRNSGPAKRMLEAMGDEGLPLSRGRTLIKTVNHAI